MRISRLAALCCAVLWVAVLIGVVPEAHAQEEKAGSKPQAKPAARSIIFSKSPIDVDKPSNLTNSFQAGDRIYGAIYLADTFRAVTETKRGKISLQIRCYTDGKYTSRGTIRVILREAACDSKTFLIELAPAPEDLSSYQDPNVTYEKLHEVLGKRGGPMQFTKFLSALPAGKHTIILIMKRYKELAGGKFTIEGKDFKTPYTKLFAELENAAAKGVTMPTPKMSDAKLEAEMAAALKASKVKEARDGQILRVVIVDPKWQIETKRTDKGTLVIAFRYLRADVAVKEKDGPCWRWRFVFRQDYVGGKFQKTQLHGIFARQKISLANVKPK